MEKTNKINTIGKKVELDFIENIVVVGGFNNNILTGNFVKSEDGKFLLVFGHNGNDY